MCFFHKLTVPAETFCARVRSLQSLLRFSRPSDNSWRENNNIILLCWVLQKKIPFHTGRLVAQLQRRGKNRKNTENVIKENNL